MLLDMEMNPPGFRTKPSVEYKLRSQDSVCMIVCDQWACSLVLANHADAVDSIQY